MSDEQTLLLVFVILYLFENLFFLHRNSLAFVSMYGARFSVKYPSTVIGNKRGGLIMSNPFSPLGFVFVSNPIQFSLNKNGVISFVSNCLSASEVPSQSKCLFSWSEINKIEKISNEIFINGKLFLKHRSSSLINQWANLISVINNLSTDSRERYIKEYLESSLNTKKIKLIKTEFFKKSRYLIILCNFIWFYIFLISPLFVLCFGFTNIVINIFLIYAFLHILTIFKFISTKRRLDLNWSQRDFLSNLFKVLVFPPAIIRAYDSFTTNLFDGFHPIALGYVFLSKYDFQKLAKELILDLKYPIILDELDEKDKPIVQDFNRIQVESINSFLKENLYEMNDIIAHSFSNDDNAKSFCPRCHAEFTIEQGICSDCSDIKLIRIDDLYP